MGGWEEEEEAGETREMGRRDAGSGGWRRVSPVVLAEATAESTAPVE